MPQSKCEFRTGAALHSRSFGLVTRAAGGIRNPTYIACSFVRVTSMFDALPSESAFHPPVQPSIDPGKMLFSHRMWDHETVD